MQSLLEIPLFQNRRFFPTNPDKKPRIPAWNINAKPAKEALAAWPGEINFGMITGDGLLVVDVDPRNGGLEEQVYKLGFPKDTFKIQTPSGGCHLYYEPEDFDIQSGAHRLGYGIDVKSYGSYVCVPPKPGYEIICDHDPLAVNKSQVQL